MKKVLLLLTMLLLTQAAISQVIQQKGVAYRYNGKQKRTPLGNVTISYAGNSRSVISGEENGVFNLVLEGKKMGDRIGVVTVKKREMMVFNQQAVDEWNIRKEPLTLILCNADEFERQKENLIAIGRSQAKKKYERQKAELEAKLNASEIKLAEYESALDKAYEDLELIQKNVSDYADLFARIDLSEVSAEEQRILDMVEEGKIDEAVKAYEELDISGKLRQAREKKKALSEAKTKIEEEENRQNQVIEELKAKQEREIATLKLAGGKENYDKIGRMLKENVLADTTDVNMAWKYATFANAQNQFDEAEQFLKMSLQNCRDENLYKLQVWAGNFYKQIRKETEAEFFYLAAIKTAREHSDMGWEIVAKNNLGDLYYNMLQFDKAGKYFLENLEYRVKLVEQDPSEENISSLALTQHNLGYLYASQGDTLKAEHFLFSALKNYEFLCERNPQKYRKRFASEQMKIAEYYLKRGSLDIFFGIEMPIDGSVFLTKADSFFNEALNNYRQLYSQDADKYRDYLSDCLNDMGKFYMFIRKTATAIPFFQEAYDLNTINFDYNPKRYQERQARSSYNMGVASEEMKDIVNAIKYYSSAFDIYGKLYKNYPDIYFDDYLTFCTKLCNLYENINDTIKYKKYINLRIELGDAEYNKDSSRKYLSINSRKDLGRFYLQTGQVNEGKALFEIIHRMDSAEFVNKIFAESYKELGEASHKKKDYKKAEEQFLSAIEYYKAYYQEIGKNGFYDINSENTGDVYFQLGKNYWMMKDTINAEKQYLQSLEYYRHVFILRKTSNEYKVLAAYTQLFELNPDAYRDSLASAQSYLASTKSDLGNIYYKTKDYVEAEETYLEAEEYYLKALATYTQSFEQNPNVYRDSIASMKSKMALVQSRLGDLYYNTKKYVKGEEYYLLALDNFKELFENSPDSYRAQLAWIQYSLMYIYANDNDKIGQYEAMLDAALTKYEELYQSNNSYLPRLIELKNRKGWQYLRKGKTDEALQIFENTYQLDPEVSVSYLASGYNAKAYDFAKVRDYSKAIETIDKAISLKPGNANYYDTKGEILLMKGDEQGAVKMWQKVIELDPDFLSKHNGSTELYKQMKERGLIE